MIPAISAKRYRLYEIVEIGAADDIYSRGYDFFSTGILIINLIVSIMLTFATVAGRYGESLHVIEAITVLFFAVDYVLRLITARCPRSEKTEGKALLSYIFSIAGLIDLFSFLPYYLPFLIPIGGAAFRMFRVIRIFRLFRINAYYDSLNVISEVIRGKKQQLLSSVFIILILMVFSSLCMYSLEHEAQPDVFENAFSGIWWSVSTLLTVGYGDIYPVTTLGQIFGIIISFLGVGMVAIPTGIISAGFVEQYTRLKRLGDYGHEEDVHFIKFKIEQGDSWAGMAVKDLRMPKKVILALIQRGREVIIPKGNVILAPGDIIVLGSESIKEEHRITLKEVVLRAQHPWNGLTIDDLDISRQTTIVMVRRRGTMLVPHGDMKLKEGDTLILHTKHRIATDEMFEI